MNQVMQEKEMCLQRISKKLFYFIFIFLFVVFFIPNQVKGNQNVLSSQISNYFFKINNFKSKFIQSDQDGIQEGSIYLSNKVKRIKIHYTDPSNIIFVLKDNKAMYFNVDLEEVEYFGTKDSLADIFFNVFYEEEFFSNSKIVEKKNTIEIKKIVSTNEENVEVLLYFEKNPLLILQIII